MPTPSDELVKRSADMLVAGYYLSRCGTKSSPGQADGPPSAIGVSTWNAAYDFFYDAMGDGRSPEQFRNSLKNTRDTFDHLFSNGRTGWVNQDGERPSIRNNFARTHEEWKGRSDQELQTFVLRLQSAISDDDPIYQPASLAVTEGGQKVYASTRRERSKKARTAAIAIHGLDCMGCGFGFEKAYGPLGKDFIEVHHVVPLSEAGRAKTDPLTDLIVLCANCHRMVHRKRSICLSLDELKQHLKDAASPLR